MKLYFDFVRTPRSTSALIFAKIGGEHRYNFQIVWTETMAEQPKSSCSRPKTLGNGCAAGTLRDPNVVF